MKNSIYWFVFEFVNEKKNRVIVLMLGNYWYFKKVEKMCFFNVYR